ncbi:c-type cytochrome [Bradyrhizobium sp.]|uniref:c-type cytochrome n=1 Tax=Bradyrhizobium sp. TaxID=376 RepID=UPI001ED50930|nr:cytochrome c [Bradyrhizobium sp.]MBV8920152.1 cytochrome c [Bradyrhizobium sp.]MBV9981109.1 cytochrome c [Bradyrhizobium sp.]
MLPAPLRASALPLLFATAFNSQALAQQSLPRSQEAQMPTVAPRPNFGESVGNGRPGVFMQVPVSQLFPGAQPNRPQIKNPVQGDPNAEQRGMTYFVNFNCVGCHAANGGGGMGPALSNSTFIYGSQPENIYLSIYQGRPNGMPAWGGVLPDSVIWDLVTYIGRISNEPSHQWGRTFTATLPSPDIEQVPATQVSTTDPWSATRSFGFGQKP